MRVRSIGTFAVALGIAIGCDRARSDAHPTADTATVADAFRVWSSAHVSVLDTSVLNVALGEASLTTFVGLRRVVGNARVVAIGEPHHGSHEPLALRNLVIRYLVTELGFTAVALETGLSTSKQLNDYVLLRSDASDSTLASAFSYGFGDFQENLDLLQWLRALNSTRPADRRVRFYGVDMTGQVFPTAYRSLDAVLSYLQSSDSLLAPRLRSQIAADVPAFRIDRFVRLPAAEQARITVEIDDLVTLLRKRRNALTALTSREDYEWALRQAVSASHDAAYMRLAPIEWADLIPAPGVQSKPDAKLPERHALHEVMAVREASIAENLAWVLQQQSRDGRVVFFAHNLHVQGHPLQFPEGQGFVSLLNGLQFAGTYIRSIFGQDAVVIGQHFGYAPGLPGEARPPSGSLDALLASIRLPAYIIDLRDLPVSGLLATWFNGEQAARYLDDESGGIVQEMLRPEQAYDAILYFDRAMPAKRRTP